MSTKSTLRFAEHMRSRSAFLRDHCGDLAEYTDPDCPLPISLFGRYGGTIASNFLTMAPSEWWSLSAMIEEGLASDDDDVSTAMATGLVEAMIHRAEAVENLWPRIEKALGPLAASYADAYRNAG